MPAFRRIHFAAPTCDGEFAFLQRVGARGRDDSLRLRAVAVIAMNELLVLAEVHEGSMIDSGEGSKTFAHFHSTLTVLHCSLTSVCSCPDQPKRHGYNGLPGRAGAR